MANKPPRRQELGSHKKAPLSPNALGTSATARGYGKDWQRLAEQVRIEEPFCNACAIRDDRAVLSECVDHKTPHKMVYELRLDRSNCWGLCWTCHQDKTTAEQRYSRAEQMQWRTLTAEELVALFWKKAPQ